MSATIFFRRFKVKSSMFSSVATISWRRDLVTPWVSVLMYCLRGNINVIIFIFWHQAFWKYTSCGKLHFYIVWALCVCVCVYVNMPLLIFIEALKYSLQFFTGFQSLKEVYHFWFVLFCFLFKTVLLLSGVPTNQREYAVWTMQNTYSNSLQG